MARDVSNMLATNLFLRKHGVDTDENTARLGVGVGSSGELLSGEGITSFIGKILSIQPNAEVNFRSANAYREEINKIAKDFEEEITGHQKLVRDNTWTVEEGAKQLSLNLKQTIREYTNREDSLDSMRRGKDKLYITDNR
jgi:hypothetical protein